MNQSDRNDRLMKKISERREAEVKKCLESMRSRSDYSPCYDYFLELAANCFMDEKNLSEKIARPLVKLLCIQAPIELIHAAGFHPFKVLCGARFSMPAASHALPALMCPMLKSVLGSLMIEADDSKTLWVLPTTCDWVVKFPEMSRNLGTALAQLHWMELPHLKDGHKGQERWLDEVYGLKTFLESHGGVIDRKSLSKSIAVYQRAWQALARLAEMRLRGLLSPMWFMLMTNMFFYDTPERWIEAAEKIQAAAITPIVTAGSARIFLVGSPIFFPNFKIPMLLEEAGLFAAVDDLCSSERIFPGAVTVDDPSLFGLMNALAQRYHQGCLCPTFIDNDRRVNNILGRKSSAGFAGVVLHVLKGCHPYDLESCGLEGLLKNNGLRFIRIETDYAQEDDRNLLTRLEAYRQTLEGI